MPSLTEKDSVTSSAKAPTTAPAAKVTQFDDWEVSCILAATTVPAPVSGSAQSGASPAPKSDCRAVQRLVVKESGETVFATTILPNAKAKPGEAFIGIVSVPLGGYLAPGMQLSIDQGKAYKILFETCNQSGCHAGFPIAGPVLGAFRKGRTASFRLWTTKTKPADVSVSLKGLPDALAAITRGGI